MVPKSGTPATKLLVPSMGSISQTYSASSRSGANSSPRIPCSGNRSPIFCRRSSSASRSARVTGEASALNSVARSEDQKWRRIRSPLS